MRLSLKYVQTLACAMPVREKRLVRWLIGMLLVTIALCLWQGSASGAVRASGVASVAQGSAQNLPVGDSGLVEAGTPEALAGSLLLVGLVFSAVAVLGLRACGQRGHIRRLRPYRWR